MVTPKHVQVGNSLKEFRIHWVIKQALKGAGGIAKVGWVGEPTGQESFGVVQLSWLKLSTHLGLCSWLLPRARPQRETQLFAHRVPW